MPYADPEVRREFQRQWVARKRAEDPAFAEKEREAVKKYRASQKAIERRRVYARDYYHNLDPDLKARWNERMKHIARNYRARKNWNDLEYVSVLNGDPCCYCGGPGPIFIDHIEPQSLGGTNDWDNLTAACGSCNSSKNATPLLLWLAWKRQKWKRSRTGRNL